MNIGGSNLELCADPQLRRHPRLCLQYVRTRKIRTITDACQGDRHFQKPKVVSLLTSEDLSYCSLAERKRQCTRGSFHQILADVDFFLSIAGMDNIPLTDHARMDIVRVDRESGCAVDTINRVSSRMNTVEPGRTWLRLVFRAAMRKKVRSCHLCHL